MTEKRSSVFPAHRLISEPELAFHHERDEDRDRHPLVGLTRSGPYSRSLVNRLLDPIRIAVLAPHGALPTVDRLLQEMESRHTPRERREYLVDFPGFSKVFGVRAISDSAFPRCELPPDLDQRISVGKNPHSVLADELTRAIQALVPRRSCFDVLVIYLPVRWSPGFYGTDDEDFDLHDFVKAVSAVHDIPVQIVREDKAVSYPCRCSVMWRLSIALYCKAGGVPWKLAGAPSDVAYVGLSYAVRNTPTKGGRFVTCCSQVFDADGAGLEFLLYETGDYTIEHGKNPFLPRTEMRRVMARSLRLYQSRHGGRSPRHVFVHKNTEFKREEIDGCFDAWQSAEGLDLLYIQQDSGWRGVKIGSPRQPGVSKGEPERYPVDRGTLLPIGSREALLWTQGNARALTNGRNFYKEGKGIPSPLVLRRHAGHGAWDEAAVGILGLTKMNWNNDALYDRLPVTLGYAQVLARTVKRMPTLASRPYQFRFFM